MGSSIQAGATGEGRVYAFTRCFVQSAADNARDMGALRLVQDGIIDCDVAQNGTSLVVCQPVDLEQRVRDFPGSR